MATTAREIGQIFAQQINFRQAIKDRIEDYIMKTELAALDPEMRKARQYEINRLQQAVSDLDSDIADIVEQKIQGIDKVRERWVAAQGTMSTAEVTAGGKVISTGLQVRGDLAQAALNAKAAYDRAVLAGKVDQAAADAARAARVFDEAAKLEAQGSSGREERMQYINGQAGESFISGGNPEVAKVRLQGIWRQKFEGRFKSLEGNPLAQRKLMEDWVSDATDALGKSKGAADLTAAVANSQYGSLAGLALGVTGEGEDYLDKNQRSDLLAKSGVSKDKPKDVDFASKYYAANFEGLYAGAPKADEIPPASREFLLGFETKEELDAFEKQAAFNKYIIDYAGETDASGNIIKPEDLKFEDFIQKSGDPKSVEASYIAEAKRSSPQDIAQYGDRGLVDLQLKRKGVQSELAETKDAYAASGSKYPSYEAVQRKTLEAYSSLYGGRGQQRLVDLAELGRTTSLTVPQFTDKTTGKTVPLDSPEYEILFRKYQEERGIPVGAGMAPPPAPGFPKGPYDKEAVKAFRESETSQMPMNYNEDTGKWEAAPVGGESGGIAPGGRGGIRQDRFLFSPEETPIVAPGGYPSTEKPKPEFDYGKYSLASETQARLDVPELEILFGKGSKFEPRTRKPIAPIGPIGPITPVDREPRLPREPREREPREPREREPRVRPGAMDVGLPPQGTSTLREADVFSVGSEAIGIPPKTSPGAAPVTTEELLAGAGDVAVKPVPDLEGLITGKPDATSVITQKDYDILQTLDKLKTTPYKDLKPKEKALLQDLGITPKTIKQETKPVSKIISDDLTDAQIEVALKGAVQKSAALTAELADADPVRAAQIQDELKAIASLTKQIIIESKNIPITEQDFASLTPEELISKVQPKPKINQSASSIRMNQDLVTFAEGSTAAAKAQKQLVSGKEATPQRFIKGSDKLSEGQVATIKNLAQKRGSVRPGELARTLASIIGVDEKSPLVEKAKSLYIAFEQLA